MKDLQGLSLSDFETKGNVILGKVEVDRDGSRNFTELEEVTFFDIQSNITNLFLKTCAKTFTIEVLNTDDKYSLYDKGKSKYDHIKQGRRIKLYIGIQKKETEEVITQEESYGEIQSFDTKEEVQDNYTNLMLCYGDHYFSTGLGLYCGRCCEGNDQYTSILFQNINIPKGMKIASAKIYLQGAYSHCGEGEIGRLKIQAEASDNPTAPTSVENWQAIEKTTAFSTMRIDDGRWLSTYPEVYDYTDDISSVVEEIVNRDGWQSGNSINIIFGPADDCDNGEQLNIQGYYTFDPEVWGGATLEIEYQEEIPEITEELVVTNDYYWSWIYGIIDNVTTSKSADGEICNISGRDYVAYLAENYLKNLWWGKQQKYDIIAEKEKYDMPTACKGIYRAFLYNESTEEYDELTLNSEFTYDWEDNQFVFLHPRVPFENKTGGLWIYYFTPQKVENVVADLLIEAGLLTYSEKQSWLTNSDLVTPTGISESERKFLQQTKNYIDYLIAYIATLEEGEEKDNWESVLTEYETYYDNHYTTFALTGGTYIDRVWFDSGTSYIDAIELLTERVMYRFGVTNLGKPFFKVIPVLLSTTAKRLNAGEYMVRNIEDRIDELYNHFYLIGEEREMKRINLGVFANGVENITTDSVTEKSTATLVGTVLADGKSSANQIKLFGGSSIITRKGFKWQKEGEAEQVYSSASSTMGLFTKEITDLDPDTRYSWLVWAKNSLGHYAESTWNTFVTPELEEV